MGLFNWIKNVLGFETEEASEPQTQVNNTAGVAVQATVSLPMDEDEKTLVGVIAACIGGKDEPDAKLHIHRITRIQ